MTFRKLGVWKDRASFHSPIKHFWAWTVCQVLGIQRHTGPREPPADVTTHLSPCLANFLPWGEKEKLLETSLSHEVFTCLPLYSCPFLLLFSSSWLLFFLQIFHTLVTMNSPNSRCQVSWLRLTDDNLVPLGAQFGVHLHVHLHMHVYTCTRVRVHVVWDKTVSLAGQEYREIHFRK